MSIFDKINAYTEISNKVYSDMGDAPSDIRSNIEDILNAIIVKNGGRRAFIHSLHRNKEVLDQILIPLFPELKALPSDYTDKGIVSQIVSNSNTLLIRADDDLASPTSDIDVGKALGYPCAEDWPELNKNGRLPRHIYEIHAILKPEVVAKYGLTQNKVQVLAFICKDTSKEGQVHALLEQLAQALGVEPGIENLIMGLQLGYLAAESTRNAWEKPVTETRRINFAGGKRKRRKTKRRRARKN